MRDRWKLGLCVLVVVGCSAEGGGGAGSTTTDEPTTGVSAPGSEATGDPTGEETSEGSEDPSSSDATTEIGSSGSLDASSGDTTGTPQCGDLLCALDEDATTCCQDCGVCDDGATVRMETGVAGGAPGLGLTPGGIADTHAYFSGGPFAEIVYPFTIEDEPVEASSWFWAQQFFFEGTTEGGYIGVQANGILGGQVVGKMMIGSIWNATEATPGPSASCEPFGGEGIGYSCRLAFEWRENVTYRMVVRESQEDWWSIIMIDPSTNEEMLLGDIHAPPEYGRIRPPTAGFAEYYGTVDACETLPHAVALLHAPVADGASPTSVDAGTYGTCAPQATSSCAGALCV
jgi:hypothetical protein